MNKQNLKKNKKSRYKVEKYQRQVASNYEIKRIEEPTFRLKFKCEGEHYSDGKNIYYDEKNKLLPTKYRELFIALSDTYLSEPWYTIKNKTTGETYYVKFEGYKAKVYEKSTKRTRAEKIKELYNKYISDRSYGRTISGLFSEVHYGEYKYDLNTQCFC